MTVKYDSVGDRTRCEGRAVRCGKYTSCRIWHTRDHQYHGRCSTALRRRECRHRAKRGSVWSQLVFVHEIFQFYLRNITPGLQSAIFKGSHNQSTRLISSVQVGGFVTPNKNQQQNVQQTNEGSNISQGGEQRKNERRRDQGWAQKERASIAGAAIAV